MAANKRGGGMWETLDVREKLGGEVAESEVSQVKDGITVRWSIRFGEWKQDGGESEGVCQRVRRCGWVGAAGNKPDRLKDKWKDLERKQRVCIKKQEVKMPGTLQWDRAVIHLLMKPPSGLKAKPHWDAHCPNYAWASLSVWSSCTKHTHTDSIRDIPE